MPASNDDDLTDSPDLTRPQPPQSPPAAELSAGELSAGEAVTVAVAEPIGSDDWGEVVIGVRLREAARIYHFSAPLRQVYVGDYVVVDAGRGEQMARVVTVPDDDPERPRPQRRPRGVRSILRLADADDRQRADDQQQRADEILRDMRVTAVRDDLDLYPVAVELTLDGAYGNAHFQAPDHVDFRALVQEIEERYDISLHMQLVHQRDRAKLVDGYDICGLRLCCSSWMTTFPKVGIRVAKDQNLSLNPDAISGVCGRLLCCLTFEHETYREMRGTLPKLGKRVSTPVGMGKVIKLDILQQKVTIALDDHAQRVDVPAAEIGLAVRTEDAPNQALLEAEERAAEQAEALRRAAAPTATPAEPTTDAEAEPVTPKKSRRSRQRRRSQRRVATSGETQTSTGQTEPDNETGESAAKPRSQRRQRRRRPRVVNPGDGATPEATADSVSDPSQSAAQTPPPKRRRQRRRRSRQSNARNQPDGQDSS